MTAATPSTARAGSTNTLSVAVLFSEPLQGSVAEVMEAAAEDYPDLDWSGAMGGGPMIDTTSATFAAELNPDPESNTNLSIVGMPGPLQMNWREAFGRSFLTFRDVEAEVSRHTDHISLNVMVRGDDVVSRFRAMRRLACLAAVFARLPTTVAVVVMQNGLVVQPDRWIHGAETAMRGELPILEWIVLWADRSKPGICGVNTIGLVPIAGAEVVFADARVEASDAANWVVVFARSLVESDQVYRDGDTTGPEGGPVVRIRKTVSPSFGGCDVWVLLHPASTVDEDAHFGPADARPHPDGKVAEHIVSFGALKSALGRFANRRQS